jgi:hypothetical protein
MPDNRPPSSDSGLISEFNKLLPVLEIRLETRYWMDKSRLFLAEVQFPGHVTFFNEVSEYWPGPFSPLVASESILPVTFRMIPSMRDLKPTSTPVAISCIIFARESSVELAQGQLGSEGIPVDGLPAEAEGIALAVNSVLFLQVDIFFVRVVLIWVKLHIGEAKFDEWLNSGAKTCTAPVGVSMGVKWTILAPIFEVFNYAGYYSRWSRTKRGSGRLLWEHTVRRWKFSSDPLVFPGKITKIVRIKAAVERIKDISGANRCDWVPASRLLLSHMLSSMPYIYTDQTSWPSSAALNLVIYFLRVNFFAFMMENGKPV